MGPTSWDVHHWQARNPVFPKGLLQLTTGGPTAVYHGGVLNCRVRHFDPAKKQAGLPEDVSALVDRVSPGRFRLQLVNLNPMRARSVVSLAGAFGEHQLKIKKKKKKKKKKKSKGKKKKKKKKKS